MSNDICKGLNIKCASWACLTRDLTANVVIVNGLINVLTSWYEAKMRRRSEGFS